MVFQIRDDLRDLQECTCGFIAGQVIPLKREVPRDAHCAEAADCNRHGAHGARFVLDVPDGVGRHRHPPGAQHGRDRTCFTDGHGVLAFETGPLLTPLRQTVQITSRHITSHHTQETTCAQPRDRFFTSE